VCNPKPSTSNPLQVAQLLECGEALGQQRVGSRVCANGVPLQVAQLLECGEALGQQRVGNSVCANGVPYRWPSCLSVVKPSGSRE